MRAEPATRTVPVIMLSARAGEESRVEGLTAGADDYLVKPFSARELLARVEANLRLARLRQEGFGAQKAPLVESAAGAWQAWAEGVRERVARSKQPLRDPADEHEGERLLARFTTAAEFPLTRRPSDGRNAGRTARRHLQTNGRA